MENLAATWEWLSTSPLLALTLTVGVIAGVLLAILAVTTNLPAVLLVVLTALAGASVATSGVAMLVGPAPEIDKMAPSFRPPTVTAPPPVLLLTRLRLPAFSICNGPCYIRNWNAIISANCPRKRQVLQ